MERRKPLRADPAKTRAWQERSRKKPIAQRSAKRIDEKPERDAVTAVTLKRDGYRCVLAWMDDCYGDLVAHEIVKRSAMAGSHLDDKLTACACSGHNLYVETISTVESESIGMVVTRATYDRLGQAALDEARRIRSLCRPERPFWRAEDGTLTE